MTCFKYGEKLNVMNKKNQINKKNSFDTVHERKSTGNAPVLVEIICERVHCPMYDYAISVVDMVAQTFGEQIDIQTIVRRGNLENSMRFLKVCKKAGRMLPVPTILINGDAVFTIVPHPEELTGAIEKYLIAAQENLNSKNQKECKKDCLFIPARTK